MHSGRRPHQLSPGTPPCFNTILKVFVFVFVLDSNASSSALSISLCLLLVRVSEVTVTSYSHPPSVSLRGIVTQSNVLSCMRAWPGLVWVYPCTRSVDTTEKQTSNVVCGFDQARSKMARFACPDKSKDRIRAKCGTCLSVHTHPKTRIGLIQTANAAPHSAADAPPPPSTSPTPGYHLVLRLR